MKAYISSSMKGLKKYLKNRIRAIVALLEKPDRKFTQDSFHQLRIEIKKLNAFFEVIEFCAKDFNRTKTFRPFETVFSLAGNFRDLQIEKDLMKKHFFLHTLKAYRQELTKQQHKALDDFFSANDKSLISNVKKSYKDATLFLKDVSKRKLFRYLEEKRKDIKELLTPNDLQPEQGHQLRKLLKSYSFIVTNPNLLDKSKNARIDKLNLVLGKWHDYRVIESHIEKSIKVSKDDVKNMQRLKKIKDRMTAKEIQLLARANKLASSKDIFGTY